MSPDFDALLRCVLERPDDDGPRLVYADALMESSAGGHDRGEFIRIGCRIAKLERYTVGDEIMELASLRQREQEILQPNGFALAFPCHEWAGTAVLACVNHYPTAGRYEWRRGFVEEITCDWPAWGGGECRRCWNHGSADGGDDIRARRAPCPICSNTGRTPGHAAAILAAQPVRRVKLTSMANMEAGIRDGDLCYSDCDGQHRGPKIDYEKPCGRLDLLKMALSHQATRMGAAPGVTFELPARVDTTTSSYHETVGGFR